MMYIYIYLCISKHKYPPGYPPGLVRGLRLRRRPLAPRRRGRRRGADGEERLDPRGAAQRRGAAAEQRPQREVPRFVGFP